MTPTSYPLCDEGGRKIALTARDFTSARDLFEAAREASRDAEKIRRQLVTMEARTRSLGSGGFEPRVSSTPSGDRMEMGIVAFVDREDALRRRQHEDYELLDLACAVLYGREQDGRGGIAKLVPEAWWADVLWWRYLDGATWEEVGSAVGYSWRRCFDVAQLALDLADSYGIARCVDGSGIAEE